MTNTTIYKEYNEDKPSVKNQAVHVVLHLAAWLIFIILPHFVINRYWSDVRFIPWSFYLNAAFYGFVFYVNYLWLVPRFFFREKKHIYFMLAVATIAVFYTLNSLTSDLVHPKDFGGPKDMGMEMDMDFGRDLGPSNEFRMDVKKRERPPIEQWQLYSFILVSCIVTGFSIGLKVIERHSATEKQRRELEKEKLNSELAFLKNQISPHFFFNTLNNIYSLVEINTKDAQASILRLSKLMRYLLYESESGEVPIGKEVDFMNHYIDLMRLRLTSKVEVNIQFPAEYEERNIPPLLFISFIENAFKHGVSYRGKSFIHIQLQVKENQLIFDCTNSLNHSYNEDVDKAYSGIGLKNVKKRLELLFPDKHTLNITTTDECYTVKLMVELK